ncbi:hypothetical protein CPC08DRAFT_721838 [Agrocybe pediades]|nr:hypothetical protein CPC08DRAFT_721838 [Agrocybe pediades]
MGLSRVLEAVDDMSIQSSPVSSAPKRPVRATKNKKQVISDDDDNVEFVDTKPKSKARKTSAARAPAKKGKKAKSAEFVDTSDDDGTEHLQVPASSPQKIKLPARKPVAAVTVTKHKLKPSFDEAMDAEKGPGSDDEGEVEGVSADDGDEDASDAGVEEGSDAVMEEDVEEDDDDEDLASVKLEKDDSMFPSPTGPSKVKVSAPRSEPPSTRRRTGAARPSPSEAESPTKKRRLAETPDNSDDSLPLPVTPTRKSGARSTSANVINAGAPAGSSNKPTVGAKKNANEISSKKTAPASNPFAKTATAKSSAEIMAIMTSTADKPAPQRTAPKAPAFHDDYVYKTVAKLPALCEVNVPDNQDEDLQEKGHYENLPPLKAVVLKPTNPYDPVGLVKFLNWNMIIPDLDLDNAMQSMSFVRDGDYINPSRVNPTDVCLKAFRNSKRWVLATSDRKTAICVSPVMTFTSHVHSTNGNLKWMSHYLTAMMHSGELPRMVSLLGMLSQKDVIETQIWNDQLTYGIKTSSQGSSDASDAPNPNLSAMFDLKASPLKANAKRAGVRKVEPLPYGAKIPVYDARDMSFDYNAHTFDNLSSMFPEFEGEVPSNSLAVFGYLTYIQEHVSSPWRMFTYIQWVIVLGTAH